MGTPAIPTETCPACNGTGEVPTGWHRATLIDPPEPRGLARCESCNGTGNVSVMCHDCGHDRAVRMEDGLALCSGHTISLEAA